MRYLRELTVHYKQTDVVLPDEKITNSLSLNQVFQSLLSDLPTEHFYMLLFDGQQKIIGTHLIGKGTIDCVVSEPADMIRIALLANSTSIAVAHNHPNGCLKPSIPDVNVTSRLKQICALFRINLVDHIIVGHNNEYFSFCDNGVI